MKQILCDACEDPTAAQFMVQDVTTGDSHALCGEHMGMWAMGIAEAYVDQQTATQKEAPQPPAGTKSETVLAVPEAEAEATPGDGRGNDGTPSGETPPGGVVATGAGGGPGSGDDS